MPTQVAAERPHGLDIDGPPPYDEIDVIHAYGGQSPESHAETPQHRIPSSLFLALEPQLAQQEQHTDMPYLVSYGPSVQQYSPGLPQASVSAVDVPLTGSPDHGDEDFECHFPEFPGIYRDRAPDLNLLNDDQRRIAKEYPPDLDDEPRTLVQSIRHAMVHWRKFVKWKYLHYYLILAAIIALIALMTIFHERIIDWLEPVSRKVQKIGWGWIIPVAILFILSFPPLFGAEIIAVLCGIVYGVWIGFGIVALGTLLGEIGNYYLCVLRLTDSNTRCSGSPGARSGAA